MSRSVALFVLVLCTAVWSAAAQAGPPVGNGGPFAGLGNADVTFVPPSNITMMNSVTTDMAAGLKTADLAQIIFSLQPCTHFAPHIHPNGTEVLTGVLGAMNAFVLVNGNLFAQSLGQFNTIIFPQDTVHFYFNNRCEQAVAQASLNSAMPGAFFFYNLPPQLLAGRPTVAAVQTLISSQQSNATADPTRLFQTLTSDCAARCGLAPSPGSGSGASAGAAASAGRRLRSAAQ